MKNCNAPENQTTRRNLLIACATAMAFTVALPAHAHRVTPPPTGGHKLTATTFIQRLNTSGGIAPLTGCTLATDVGKKELVPYTADYFFYKATESDADDGN